MTVVVVRSRILVDVVECCDMVGNAIDDAIFSSLLLSQTSVDSMQISWGEEND